jgi:hypothetical protein
MFGKTNVSPSDLSKLLNQCENYSHQRGIFLAVVPGQLHQDVYPRHAAQLKELYTNFGEETSNK